MKKILSILALTLFVSFGNSQSSKSNSTTTSSNLSISVSDDDNDYSYTARFDPEKTEKVKNLITKILDKSNSETERTALWEGKGFSISLRQGRIKMELDKNDVTKSFQVKFEDLGDQISEVLGSPKAPEPPKPPKRN